MYYTINNSTSHGVLIEGFRRGTVSFVAADALYLEPNLEFKINRLTGEDNEITTTAFRLKNDEFNCKREPSFKNE